MGTQPHPLLKKEAEPGGGAPQFSAHVYCGQTAGWINMALVMEVGLGLVHIVLDTQYTAPLSKRRDRDPQFSASLYCGQTAGCIKMPLCMEVGLGPGDFGFDGTQLHKNKCSAVAEMGDRLATIDIGQKLGRGCAPIRGELYPHRGLPSYQVSS